MPEAEPPAAREPLGALLRRLEWTVLRPLAVHLGGQERTLLRSAGMELAELREYQPGDDVRYIDWNVTARSERAYIRETYAERALDAWLLLDLSASVDWGTASCRKRERAREFAAVAGQLLSRHGNRLGALPFAERPRELVPPASGRAAVLRLLARIQEEPSRIRSGPTDLAGALALAQRVIRRRALVLVVSDFLVPDGWQPALARLAYRHEVVAVRLTDPREREIPDIGLVTFEDPETGVQLVVDTGDRRLRERFRAAAEQQAERLRSELRACGVDLLELDTAEALLPPLRRFLELRRQRRAARGPMVQGRRFAGAAASTGAARNAAGSGQGGTLQASAAGHSPQLDRAWDGQRGGA
uniref:DUF58 domain-containing protein n=1 Tax=Thermorudis peleae TaxID=1382356 RepID=A0A831THA4_9BACT